MQAVSKVIPKGRQNQSQTLSVKMHVTGGITVSAAQRPLNANIGISARSVEGSTKLMNAKNGRREELEPHAKCPHYTHSLL